MSMDCMEVGDQVIWQDDDKIERICTILSVNTNQTYDILLSERNVMYDSVYRLMTNDQPITKGERVVYKKNEKLHEAIVSKVDWGSNSLQIQIIMRNIS